MNMKDLIGIRGESIFNVLITDWCANNANKPWFTVLFLGEKHEDTDYIVELCGAGSTYSMFWVQVKATRSRYRGIGTARKLNVGVTRKTVDRLKNIGSPAYVVGIDIDSKKGYIKAITPAMTSGFRGIPTNAEITCATLKQLWDEVYAYWSTASGRILNTHFA